MIYDHVSSKWLIRQIGLKWESSASGRTLCQHHYVSVNSRTRNG
jgi:hypothetical protein